MQKATNMEESNEVMANEANRLKISFVDFFNEFAFIDPKTLDFDFDSIERSVLSESIGFGNPHSKLTAHEQFLLWKQMIQQGLFRNRDEFCNTMATYSTFEQAQHHLSSLRPLDQA